MPTETTLARRQRRGTLTTLSNNVLWHHNSTIAPTGVSVAGNLSAVTRTCG